jgi:transposase
MPIDSAALPDDVDALKRIIGEMARDAVAARAEIEKLRFQLARFRRAAFGQSSEKVERTIAQLELAIETLEEDDAQRIAAIPAVTEVIAAAAEQNAKPARRALPKHLEREQLVHPGLCTCPRCGGASIDTLQNDQLKR